MEEKHGRQKFGEYLASWENSFGVGWFLAWRQIRRGNPWTSALIIAVMTFTFLNLVVVSGILVGLIEGSVRTIKDRYTGDVILSTPRDKPYIEQSSRILTAAARVAGVRALTPRYLEMGVVEANYARPSRDSIKLPETANAIIAGIDPEAEDRVTKLSDLVIEGAYLAPDDYDQVLVGAMLLEQYTDFEAQGFPTLKGVEVGTKIRVTVNSNTREVTVKGIVKSKADEIDRRVFFADSQLRALLGRFDYNVDEVAIRLAPGTDPVAVRDAILAEGAGTYAKVQTQEEAEPKFLKDIKETFAILGNLISAIGLAVAAITVFIVIFINAVTRRRFIGILKGIGVEGRAIEIAYVVQSFAYALLGTAFGSALVFFLLKPYLDRNPIDFPFSDGILVATPEGTVLRAAVLLLATFIAGYIPARLIVRQNTLDAILGR